MRRGFPEEENKHTDMGGVVGAGAGGLTMAGDWEGQHLRAMKNPEHLKTDTTGGGMTPQVDIVCHQLNPPVSGIEYTLSELLAKLLWLSALLHKQVVIQHLPMSPEHKQLSWRLTRASAPTDEEGTLRATKVTIAPGTNPVIYSDDPMQAQHTLAQQWHKCFGNNQQLSDWI